MTTSKQVRTGSLSAVLYAALVTIAIAVLALLFNRPDALMLIDVRAQRIEYVVAQADPASIGLPLPTWLSGGPDGRRCIVGVLEPAIGNRVSYELIDGSMIVDVERGDADRGARLRTENGTEQLGGETRVVLGRLNACATDASTSPDRRAWRLPVHGPAVLGQRPHVPEVGTDPDRRSEALLLGGTVNVFGRGIRDARRLYPAGDFELTGATVLRTPIGNVENGLYGHALFEPGKLQAGSFDSFAVQGSAVTPFLRVQRSTLTARPIDEQERIEATLLASLFRDPALLFLQASAAIFFTVAHFAFAWFGLRNSR